MIAASKAEFAQCGQNSVGGALVLGHALNLAAHRDLDCLIWASRCPFRIELDLCLAGFGHGCDDGRLVARSRSDKWLTNEREHIGRDAFALWLRINIDPLDPTVDFRGSDGLSSSCGCRSPDYD